MRHNTYIAGLLLNESYENLLISEGFEDMKFPIKFHTNIIKYAKDFVSKEIPKIDDFENYKKQIKAFGASSVYLEAESKDELVDIAVKELDRYSMENVFGDSIKNGVAIIKDEKEFVKKVGGIFAAIAIQLGGDELALPIENSAFGEVDPRDSMISAKRLYDKIVKNPKVYGTIANA